MMLVRAPLLSRCKVNDLKGQMAMLRKPCWMFYIHISRSIMTLLVSVNVKMLNSGINGRWVKYAILPTQF
jgi:hypothetical protein